MRRQYEDGVGGDRVKPHSGHRVTTICCGVEVCFTPYIDTRLGRLLVLTNLGDGWVLQYLGVVNFLLP
jgi:hypothetical protein